jgi:hypothetical protein
MRSGMPLLILHCLKSKWASKLMIASTFHPFPSQIPKNPACMSMPNSCLRLKAQGKMLRLEGVCLHFKISAWVWLHILLLSLDVTM